MGKFFVYLLSVAFFASCNNKPNILSLNLTVQDSIYMHLEPGSTVHQIFNSRENNISFFNNETMEFYEYNLDEKHIVEIRNINVGDDYFADAYSENFDSLYMLLIDNKLILNTRNGKKIYWDLNTIKNEIDTEGNILNGFVPLRIVNDTAVLAMYPSMKLDIENYTKNMHHLFVTLDSNGVSHLYNKKKVYNESFFKRPSFVDSKVAWINNNEFVQSYSTLDSLFYYDMKNNTNKSFFIQSDLMQNNETFDFKNIGNAAYNASYEVSNGYICNLLYNNQTKELYVLLKHGVQYIAEDGTKTKFFNCPFSLLVYDSDFKKTKEIFIPAKTIGFTYLTFLNDNKLYIPANESKQDKENETKFYIVDTNF